MPQIIMLIILIAAGGGFFYYLKLTEKKKKKQELDKEAIAEKTAQDFVNVKDLGENCLYTNDGMIFAYLKIEGLCLELYSRLELQQISRKLTSALSNFRHPYKYLSVSRPIDISKTLQNYWDLRNEAEGGRRQLLKEDMEALTEMVMRGETLERQYYIVIWDNLKREGEREITARAEELRKIFGENGIHAELVDRKGIVRLCNLVNIPAYVHIEDTDITTAMTVLKEGV